MSTTRVRNEAVDTRAPRDGYAPPVLLRRLAAGVVGLAGLSLEIAYTRIVSFKLFYYYTYFVIGLALLGFGAAATVTALSVRLRRADALDTVRRFSPAGGAVGVLAYLLGARLPTDVNLIWAGTAGQALTQLLILFVVAAIAALMFTSILPKGDDAPPATPAAPGAR